MKFCMSGFMCVPSSSQVCCVSFDSLFLESSRIIVKIRRGIKHYFTFFYKKLSKIQSDYEYIEQKK